jgi:hypothetical protein
VTANTELLAAIERAVDAEAECRRLQEQNASLQRTLLKMCRNSEAIEGERDRYRAALEQIAALARPGRNPS